MLSRRNNLGRETMDVCGTPRIISSIGGTIKQNGDPWNFLFQNDIYNLYNIDIDYQDCITSYHIQNILFLNNLCHLHLCPF